MKYNNTHYKDLCILDTMHHFLWNLSWIYLCAIWLKFSCPGRGILLTLVIVDWIVCDADWSSHKIPWNFRGSTWRWSCFTE